MKSFISNVSSVQASGASNKVSMIAAKFRKGYDVPDIPYQTNGIFAVSLWPSQNSAIRIIPAVDASGHAMPQNINVDNYSDQADPTQFLSDTFITASTVDRLGSIRRPLIVDYKPGTSDALAYGKDTAITLFARAIYNACDTKKRRKGTLPPHPDFANWISFNAGQKLTWSRPSLLMQSLTYIINGRPNYDLENDRPLLSETGAPLPMLCVVVLSNREAISTLIQALVEPINPGLPLDAHTNNRLGPMAEQDGNMLWLVSKNVADAGIGASGNAKSKYRLTPSVQEGGVGWTPTPHPLSDEQVRNYWHPWDQLLNFMSCEEQLHLLAQEFGADTVNYVFTQDRDCLDRGVRVPDDIASAGIGRYAGATQFSMPGMSQAASASLGFQGRPTGAPAPAVGIKVASMGMPQPMGVPQPAQAPQPAAMPQPAAGIASGFSVQSRRPDGVMGAGAKTNSLGIPEGSGVDIGALQAQLADIRKAAGMTQAPTADDRAAKAGDLLDGDDFTFGQEG